MRLPILAVALSVLAGPSAAVDFSYDGFADARLILPSNQRSYYAGGLGKLRYGAEDGTPAVKLADVVGEGRLLLTPELLLTATGRINPYYGPAVDLVEAYARYRPISTNNWLWSVKAGAFFPPGSLENDQIGWTPYWTITPSAINSWMGYELRTIGAEGTIEWRTEVRRVSLAAAVFGDNDPAGVLMADRGWSFDDQASGLFQHERIPDAFAVQVHRKPPLSAELFRQIGNSPGWYADLKWSESEIGDFSLMRYDNEADPSAKSYGEFAWRTYFWNGGFRKQIGSVIILAQAMTGTTIVAPNPAKPATWHFSSAYALAGYDLGDWRIAARADLFRTHNLAPSIEDENGCAGTFDVTWYPNSWLQLSGEVVVVSSDRDQRTVVAETPDQVERELQLMARVYF